MFGLKEPDWDGDGKSGGNLFDRGSSGSDDSDDSDDTPTIESAPTSPYAPTTRSTRAQPDPSPVEKANAEDDDEQAKDPQTVSAGLFGGQSYDWDGDGDPGGHIIGSKNDDNADDGSSSDSSKSSSSGDSRDPAKTIEDRAKSGDSNPFTTRSDDTFDPTDPSTYDTNYTPTGEDSEVRVTEDGNTTVVIDRSRDGESDVGPQPGDPRKGPALITKSDDGGNDSDGNDDGQPNSGGPRPEPPAPNTPPEVVPIQQRIPFPIPVGQGGQQDRGAQQQAQQSDLPMQYILAAVAVLVVAFYYSGGRGTGGS